MKDQPIVSRHRKYGEDSVSVMQSVVPNSRAQLAASLMDKTSLHAVRTGEDSAGRATWRGLSPAEVAARCCEMADAAFSQFEAYGWLTPMPELPAEKETE